MGVFDDESQAHLVKDTRNCPGNTLDGDKSLILQETVQLYHGRHTNITCQRPENPKSPI